MSVLSNYGLLLIMVIGDQIIISNIDLLLIEFNFCNNSCYLANELKLIKMAIYYDLYNY